jgi:hypothetical protein
MVLNGFVTNVLCMGCRRGFSIQRSLLQKRGFRGFKSQPGSTIVLKKTRDLWTSIHRFHTHIPPELNASPPAILAP